MVNLRTFQEYDNIDRPKRLMKYILIWCSQGQATVVVDEKELMLKANSILTITSGQIHYFKDIANTKGTFWSLPLIFSAKPIMILN
jgi:hypothetical protein